MAIPVPILESPYGNGDPFVSNPRMVTVIPIWKWGRVNPRFHTVIPIWIIFIFIICSWFACDGSINTPIKGIPNLVPLSSCCWQFCQIALFTHAVDEYPETERGSR